MVVSKQGLSCVEIEVLMFWRYSPPDAMRPLHARSPAWTRAELRFERRDVLRRRGPTPSGAFPCYVLSPKGEAIVERIQSAALGIVRNIAPFPPVNREMAKPWTAADDIDAGDVVKVDHEARTVRRAHRPPYGMPNWASFVTVDPEELTRQPYESFTARAFREAGERIRATIRQAAEASAANARAQMRGGPWDTMKPPQPTKPKRGKFADVPRWIHRYERFKRTGTRLHEAGLLTRAEWRALFTEVFDRTDKLRDFPCANTINRKFLYLAGAGIKGPEAYRQIVYATPTTTMRNAAEMQ
jgi:hypothetical protein